MSGRNPNRPVLRRIKDVEDVVTDELEELKATILEAVKEEMAALNDKLDEEFMALLNRIDALGGSILSLKRSVDGLRFDLDRAREDAKRPREETIEYVSSEAQPRARVKTENAPCAQLERECSICCEPSSEEQPFNVFCVNGHTFHESCVAEMMLYGGSEVHARAFRESSGKAATEALDLPACPVCRGELQDPTVEELET